MMVKAIVAYFQFYTIIPIPLAIRDFTETFQKGIWAFGFFGMLYGAILGAVYAGLLVLFPRDVAWMLTMGVDIWLTNGFHYDGLADTVDGLLSSRPNREDQLKIMKDSRIGTNGVLALVGYLLAVFAAGRIILASLPLWQEILAVAVFYAVIRAGQAASFIRCRYAGLNRGTGAVAEGIPSGRLLFALLSLGVFAGAVFGWAGLAAYLLALLVNEGFKRFVYRHIQGMTGDTLGASGLVTQLAFLLALTACLKLGGRL